MRLLLLALPLLMVLLPARAATADQVVTFDSRPGVKQSVLILEPKGAIKGVVLMFPGHEGVVRFVKTDDGFDVDSEGGGQNCQNGYHTFAGLQRQTASAIGGWVFGNDFRRAIHD